MASSTMSPLKPLRNPVFIAVCALLFRLALIPSGIHWIGTPANRFEGNEPGHIAAHILRGEGFGSPFTELPIPTAQQPPLYPFFVAAVFAVFGIFSKASLLLLIVSNCLAGSVTAFVLYHAVRKILSDSTGLLAAWSWALLPMTAINDLMLSGYAFAALAVALWLYFVPDLAPRLSRWIAFGIATGFMLLLNPMLVLLVPASALWLHKKQVLVIAVMALFVMSPWYVRNYRVMGRVFPALRDNLGMELYLGNHPGMSGTCDYWTGQSPYGGELPKVGEVRFFELRKQEAIAYILASPMDCIRRSGRRFLQFWFTPWPLVSGLLLGLALLGIRFVPRPLAVFAATLFVFYPLVFYVTQAAWPTAYRHPLEPVILLASAAAVFRKKPDNPIEHTATFTSDALPVLAAAQPCSLREGTAKRHRPAQRIPGGQPGFLEESSDAVSPSPHRRE